MSTTTTEPGLTRAQLVQIVRTNKPIKGVAKMRALAALGQRERKDVGDVLLEVVANREELPRFRHLAAMGLYKMGGARGQEALVGAAREADPSSAPAIAVGLGRIGTAESLPIVERLAEVARPPGIGRRSRPPCSPTGTTSTATTCGPGQDADPAGGGRRAGAVG
jgi:hypothetical protein